MDLVSMVTRTLIGVRSSYKSLSKEHEPKASMVQPLQAKQ